MSIETLRSPQVRGAHSRVERQQARSVPRALALVPLAGDPRGSGTAHVGTCTCTQHPATDLYIYGGHQLIDELWHGGGSPLRDLVFRRSDLYPVLAAMLRTTSAVSIWCAARAWSSCWQPRFFCSRLRAGRSVTWPAQYVRQMFAGLRRELQDLGVLSRLSTRLLCS